MDVHLHDLIDDPENKLQQLLNVLVGDEEIMLVTDLINDAMWYDEIAGVKHARRVAEQIHLDWGLSGKNTCITKLDDDKNTSSADNAVLYVRNALDRTRNHWSGKNFLSGIGHAAKSNFDNIVLVDDFIGSGAKAVKKINWITENRSSSKNIFVATFVGQYRSKRPVGAESTAYYASHWGWRSISDVYLPEIARKNLKMMLEIEARFGTINDYDQLGNGRLESTFFPAAINTPNNVLPIFWQKKHSRNKNFVPMLSRNFKK